jgi:hypothetical protein
MHQRFQGLFLAVMMRVSRILHKDLGTLVGGNWKIWGLFLGLGWLTVAFLDFKFDKDIGILRPGIFGNCSADHEIGVFVEAEIGWRIGFGGVYLGLWPATCFSLTCMATANLDRRDSSHTVHEIKVFLTPGRSPDMSATV